MKKQFFTLLLSAAIFTTHPLWAMDNFLEGSEEERGSSVPSALHVTSSLHNGEDSAEDHKSPGHFFEHADLKFEDEIAGIEGLGEDLTIRLIPYLPVQSFSNLFSASRGMYKVSQNPFVWSLLCTRDEFEIPAKMKKCIQCYFKGKHSMYSNLFTHQEKVYSIPLLQLIEMTKRCQSSGDHRNFQPRKYICKMGEENKFCLLHKGFREFPKKDRIENANGKDFIHEIVEWVQPTTYVNFTWDDAYPSLIGHSGFLCTLSICERSKEYSNSENFESKEHDKMLSEADEVRFCSYLISRIK